MKGRRITVTAYEGVNNYEALAYARALVLAKVKKEGALSWDNGICASFSDRAKGLAIKVWRYKKAEE